VSNLRLLHLEDSPLDAELILATLAAGGIDCDVHRVQTRADFEAALADGCYDLILADYSLPAFDGITALRIAHARCPGTPFLFVSGALGEELAIETLKNGATDYVLKQRLERLVPSVRRALREAEERAERKRLQEALRQRAEQLAEIDRRKDEFLAMLAHELRNPLAPIRNALQILRLRDVADPLVRQARDIIDRQVQQMTRLVDDLLDVARISRGKIRLRKERVELRKVVNLAVETTRPFIDKRQHQLTVSLPPEPLWLEADPVRLEQILANLLNNAAKYTDPGGRIWLTAERVRGTRDAAEDVVLRVRDNGIGIPPEMRARIFEAFAQADQSLDRSQGGLGIGLTLVRLLAELHGGAVEVHSEGAGKGSQFTVRLPLDAREAPAAAHRSAVNAAQSLRPRRVLVVDDNQDGAESLGMMLRLWGHEAYLAFDGPGALRAVEEYRPEAVFMDIGLPEMDGYQVAKRLRERYDPQRLVLVALTGYGQDEDRRRSSEAGFNYHLVKPVDLGALETILDSLRAPQGADAS
jgi:signal transduction histidine kinase/ActR/RegA family two-component response regulator